MLESVRLYFKGTDTASRPTSNVLSRPVGHMQIFSNFFCKKGVRPALLVAYKPISVQARKVP